jgi:hypothetical protein
MAPSLASHQFTFVFQLKASQVIANKNSAKLEKLINTFPKELSEVSPVGGDLEGAFILSFAPWLKFYQ